ncbi:hypothetical protein IAT38_000491 [Cryptococcus sp. DSM 104549]
MARDPPSLLNSTELSDVSLTPTAVRSAKITIIHPQLRDLVLPLARGRLFYPRGTSIEEQRWLPPADDEGTSKRNERSITGSARPILKLDFAPNCLTASQSIFACGGQHGELYVCDLPQPDSSLPERFAPPKLKGFTIYTNIPSHSINNSIIIPPAWPSQWAKRSEERKIGYVGRGSRSWEEMESGVLGRTDKGEWVTRSALMGGQSQDGYERMDVDDEDGDGETDEDEVDEDNEDIFETAVHSPASTVATYPNTVPFLHGPRMSQGSSTIQRVELPSSSRRRDAGRGASPQGSSSRGRQPPIQYVTSRPYTPPVGSGWQPGTSAADPRLPSPLTKPDEPRLFISNNDCTVKVFSLRSAPRPSHPSERPERWAQVNSSTHHLPRDDFQPARAFLNRGARLPPRIRSTIQPDTSDLHEFDLSRGPEDGPNPFTIAARESEALAYELLRSQSGLTGGRGMLDRDREEFERIVGVRVGMDVGRQSEAVASGSRYGVSGGDTQRRSENDGGSDASTPLGRVDEREERRLHKIGGTRFGVATNHSSLSPDLKHMVSVGDSTDVNLFEVVDGGREFRKIAVYNAATDAGFSTAWSKDGRKFAVASQDGQVTVWDHRSSRPLAVFHTSPDSPASSQPSFLDDVTANYHRLNEAGDEPTEETLGWNVVHAQSHIVLRDPVTGTPRTGSSTSGKEAARVVKFSPEGSSRDLMVFSEENSNIHIIDARTFATHVIVPVPSVPNGSVDPEVANKPRTGVEGGTWGIAGVAFDPSGDFLYSGTERTVVEWDMRRLGGQGGTWAMA